MKNSRNCGNLSTYTKKIIKGEKSSQRYTDFVSFVLFINDGEPSCSQEAIDYIGNAKWKVAMKEEMDSLEKNKTWELVKLPKDGKTIGCNGCSN